MWRHRAAARVDRRAAGGEVNGRVDSSGRDPAGRGPERKEWTRAGVGTQRRADLSFQNGGVRTRPYGTRATSTFENIPHSSSRQVNTALLLRQLTDSANHFVGGHAQPPQGAHPDPDKRESARPTIASRANQPNRSRPSRAHLRRSNADIRRRPRERGGRSPPPRTGLERGLTTTARRHSPRFCTAVPIQVPYSGRSTPNRRTSRPTRAPADRPRLSALAPGRPAGPQAAWRPAGGPTTASPPSRSPAFAVLCRSKRSPATARPAWAPGPLPRPIRSEMSWSATTARPLRTR
jgi:hypothetical protein